MEEGDFGKSITVKLMLKIGLIVVVLGIIGAFVLFSYNSGKPKIETKDSIGQVVAEVS